MRRFLTFRFWRWPLAVALALPLLGVLVLWVANRHDDELLPEAAEARRFVPPDAQAMRRNSYFLLLGLGAPAGEDPQQAGEQVFMRDLERYHHRFEHDQEWADHVQAAFQTDDRKKLRCPAAANCMEHYDARRTAIEEALRRHSETLSRYRALGESPAYEEVPVPYAGFQMPRYDDLFFASELVGMQAALLLQSNQPREALECMRRNTQLHQRLLEGSRTLIGAMVVLAAAYRHQRLLSEMARAFPALVARDHDAWETALGSWPLSLAPAAEGEIRWSMALGAGMVEASPSLIPAFRGTWSEFIEEWLSNALVRLAYLPHQRANLVWQRWEDMSVLARLPAHALDAAIAQPQQRVSDLEGRWTYWPRNLMGRSMLGLAQDIALPARRKYFQRTHDIEGHRRLVRLQLQAYRQGITSADMAHWLEQSPQALRSPYTPQQPMLWDKEQQSLVFQGREPQPQNAEPNNVYRARLF
ncbi:MULTISPECIES: hypothetical protein [unclassified Delftia]|uniref:hypothetical protein n=1 Tax=unclassified Delftia TaxID=2613839 RepID=UPI000648A4A6|nr:MULTISPECIES: hypothetical protein [unclassified Delftia]MDC2857751.1 hypothetical protein [Delftia sp. DT-2]